MKRPTTAIELLERFGKARDREVDREWRIVELTDDQASDLVDYIKGLEDVS